MKGASDGASGTAHLTVKNVVLTADLNHDGKVDSLDLMYFVYAYNNFGENGIVGPICDFNHDGQINFHDLVLFVLAYIAYEKS